MGLKYVAQYIPFTHCSLFVHLLKNCTIQDTYSGLQIQQQQQKKWECELEEIFWVKKKKKSNVQLWLKKGMAL